MLASGGAATGLPAAIVVGRTLSTPSTAATSAPSPSYFVGDVQNNQETITYTVYNEQADPETGVLLTTTLEPGVTLRRAPRSSPTRAARTWPGAWGRSTGYDRASVTLTVVAGQARPRRSSTPAPRPSPRSTPAPSRTPRPPRRLQPGNVSTPACSPPRPTPTRPTRSSRKRRPSSTTTRSRSSTSCTPRSATTRTSARSAARAARSGRAPAMRSTSPAWAWP